MKKHIQFFTLITVYFLLNTATAQDRVAITIYNQNLALVYEKRQMSVPRGQGTVSFPEVAAQIDPTSVRIKVLNDPQSCQIREQNYEYDLVSSDKIFQKYLEKEISFATKNSGVVKGELLNASGGDFVLRKKDGSLLVLTKSEILSTEFPSLPEGLKSRPTLVWMTQNAGATNRNVEVSYITRGVNWHAEYVGVLNEDDSALQLNGWVSIDNKCGASFKEARLKLVAGDVNLIAERRPPVYRPRMEAVTLAAAPPDFAEKSFFEYHLYTLQRPATIRENQIKQITFIPESNSRVKKRYVYDAQRDVRNVSVLVEFKNAKANGLGIPLPAGKVRIYKADDDDSQLFLGEDRIEHTPKDELVRLTIGKAFDIIGERQKTGEQKLGRRSREQTFEIKLRNHKDDDVTVTVVERFYGDWEIRRSSQPPVTKTAEKAEWEVRVPKDGEAVLQFTVLTQW